MLEDGKTEEKRERYYNNDKDVEKQRMADFFNMFNFCSTVPHNFRDHKYSKGERPIMMLTAVVTVITVMTPFMIYEGYSVQTPSFIGS